MTLNWEGAIGTTLGILIFLGPFAYKDRRSRGSSHFLAIMEVGMLFVILLLLIVGGSNALYGLGVVIDEPPQILGSGGYYPGQRHFEDVSIPHLVLGLVLMAAAWILGTLAKLGE